MFAHKKNYGCAGYVDDPLPNIAYTVPMALLLHYKVLLRVFLHFMALHAFHLHFVVFSMEFYSRQNMVKFFSVWSSFPDNCFFFMLSVSARLKKKANLNN